MALYDQIKEIYPSLTDKDFDPLRGTIMLCNASDGKGDFIAKWENSNPQPTQEQLQATGK